MKGAGGRCVYGRSFTDATMKVALRSVSASAVARPSSSSVTSPPDSIRPLSGSKSRPLASRLPSSSIIFAATGSAVSRVRSVASTSQ